MKDKTVSTKIKMQSVMQTLNVQTINTWYRRKKTIGAKTTGQSLTVPDMSLSMRQILERFSRGQSIPRKTDAYYSEEDTTEFDKMDKFEKLEAAHNIRQEIEKMQHEMQNKAEQKQELAPGKQEKEDQPPKEDDKNSETKK